MSQSCSICRIEKPLSEFYKDRKRLNGHRSQCITCIKKAINTPERREKRLSYHKAYHLTYYSKNRLRIAIKRRKNHTAEPIGRYASYSSYPPDIAKKLKEQRDNEKHKASRLLLRTKAFKVIANGSLIQCAKFKEWDCCSGISDFRFLQFDHILGGGKKHMRELKASNYMYKWIIDNPEEARNRLQILCANANWIKRYTLS